MSIIAAIAPAAEHAPLTGRRVLIIEDEYFIADDITRAIASLGADVVGPVAEVAEARRILDAGMRIDGALLDINIRSEMIFPLARALRSRGIPFVFATGYDKDVLAAEFRDVPVWEKPLDFAAVARSLASLILAA